MQLLRKGHAAVDGCAPRNQVPKSVRHIKHQTRRAKSSPFSFGPPKINAPDGKFKSPCNQQRPDLPTIAAPSLLGWSQGGHVTAMPTKLPFHSMSWMSAYLAGCLFIRPASETATTTTAEPTHCT